MATIEQITSLLDGLTAESLDQVLALVETLKEKESRATTWTFDFLDGFKETTRSGMEVKVEQAICAGVARTALWEHPPMSGSASVAYLVAVPPKVRQLKLKFAIGIRDGSELPSDRYIAFRVMVNTWKIWSAVKNSHDWEEHEIKMPQLSSDVARIEFITDGLGDNRWNWAVWGEPRLEGDQ